MWKYLGWTGKGTEDHPMLLWFLVVGIDLRLRKRDLKVELKFLVGCLFCSLIAWIPHTGNGNAEIIILVD